MLVRNVVRVQARLRSMYRARGISSPGKGLYNPKHRQRWLKELPMSPIDTRR